MRTIHVMLALMFTAFFPLAADSNISKIHYTICLSQANRANVVRLRNDKNFVRYIFEAWLDGLEIDSPDDQLGGSLCLRINRAGGKYIPGCLLCRDNEFKNYMPAGCYGIFTESMLRTAYEKAKNGTPIRFVGHGMTMTVLIKQISFTNLPLSGGNDHKVERLLFDLDIQPNASVPESRPFQRID